MPGKLNKDVLIYLIYEPRPIFLTPSGLPCCLIGPLNKVILNRNVGVFTNENETLITLPNYDPTIMEKINRKYISMYEAPYLNPDANMPRTSGGEINYDIKLEIECNIDKNRYELMSLKDKLFTYSTSGWQLVNYINVDWSIGTVTIPGNLGYDILGGPLINGTLEAEGLNNFVYYRLSVDYSINLTNYIMVGDKIIIKYTQGGTPVYHVATVTKVEESRVKFNPPITSAITPDQALFLRPLAGKVFISYVAFTKEKANNIIPVESSDSLKAIEMPTPYNPLLLAAAIALQNCNNRIFYLVPIPSQDDMGYGSALETIKQSTLRLYNIAILTQSTGAINMLIGHVNERSEPKKGDWRRCWINREWLPPEKIIVSGTGSRDANNYYQWNDPNTDFILAGVQSQDKLEFTYNQTEYSFTIAVVNQNSLIVTAQLPDVSNVAYNVKRYYTKTQQADYWISLAEGYSNHRVNLVEPDLCKIIMDNKEYTVSGVYLAAAKAALSSGILPSWPLAYRGLSGFYSLIHSNDYFDADTIDKLAENGVDIIVQEIEGSPPFSKKARTTDKSNITKAIQSIISAADYTAYYILDILKAYVGKYNITDDLLTLIFGSCGIALNELIAFGLPDRAIINKGSRVISVRPDPENPTHLIVEIDIQPLWPAETIRVYIYV